MTNRLNGCRLDPAIRDRVLEALKTLTDALDQSAANRSYAATDNLREAADGAMRAVARVTLELHAA
jgi:exopolyphosphatase/pppGpp-phosphohydrolase